MRRLRSLVPPTVATLLLLAACGGGGGGGGDGVASLSEADTDSQETTETTLSEEEAEEALLDWVSCMREQGVDIPDPQFGEDGGISIIARGPGAGGDEGDGGGGAVPFDRDEMEAATEACGEPPSFGGEFSEEDREEMQEQALALAECMRDEGVEDFPDPDFSDFGPGAGPATRGGSADPDEGGSGPRVSGPFGEVDLSDPEVAAAFEACQDEMGGGRLGGGPGAGEVRVERGEASG